MLTADGAVTSDTNDPDTSNNHASAQAVVSAPIENTDLAITATATPAPVTQGQLLTFALTVTNNGPIAATNVILSMNTPSQTTFQAMTVPSGWTTQTPSVGGTGNLSAAIGRLDVGATAVFTVTMRRQFPAPVAGTITGAARIASESVTRTQQTTRRRLLSPSLAP